MKTVTLLKREWKMKSKTPALLLLSLISVSPAIAKDYHVGDGQPYPAIEAVPFESLQPGDNVLIHWRAEPYRSKILLSQSGTYDQPIRIAGVPGPNGEKPILDGQNAVSRNVSPFYQPLEDNGLILISRRLGQAYGAKVRYVEVSGLDVRNSHLGNSYAASDGKTRPYIRGSAGIYVIDAENVAIKNCDIHLNGNGIFSKSFGDEAGQTRNLLIDGNHLFDNGNVGSDQEHSSYIEAINVTYQNNRYDPLLAGALGSQIKDRSAGTLIRDNVIKGGARMLDLVEAEDGYAIIGSDPGYRKTVVYGNLFLDERTDLAVRLIHYGGDSGITDRYRKGELYFEQNTVVIRANQTGANAKWRVNLFEASTNDEAIDATNNIIYVTSVTLGSVPATFEWMCSYGILNLGKNWVSQNGYIFRDGMPVYGTAYGVANLLTSADNNPGFADPSGDYRLKPGSFCIGTGGALPAYMTTITDIPPYVLQQDIANLASVDLGAYRTTSVGAITAPTPTTGDGSGSGAPPVSAGPILTDFSLDYATIQSFDRPNATITLSSVPKSVEVVQVTSDNPAIATVPSTRSIWAPNVSCSFQVVTYGVIAPTPVTLTVTYKGVSKSITLIVTPRQ